METARKCGACAGPDVGLAQRRLVVGDLARRPVPALRRRVGDPVGRAGHGRGPPVPLARRARRVERLARRRVRELERLLREALGALAGPVRRAGREQVLGLQRVDRRRALELGRHRGAPRSRERCLFARGLCGGPPLAYSAQSLDTPAAARAVSPCLFSTLRA